MSWMTRRALLHHVASTGGVLAINGLLPRVAQANDLRVGRTAPPATLVQLDGQQVSTKDLLGRVVIHLGDLVRPVPRGTAVALPNMLLAMRRTASRYWGFAWMRPTS